MKKQQKLGYGLVGLSILLLVVLSFVKAGVDRESTFLCEAVAENPSLSMEDCPAHKSNTSWFIVVAFGLAFIVLGAGVYMLFTSKETEAKKEFREIDEARLDEEEKRVYAMIKSNKGSVYQTDLIKETGYSKVKITRILDKMESKDIVERKRRGMTNIIVLK
jgi:uncharacterized membrane protein